MERGILQNMGLFSVQPEERYQELAPLHEIIIGETGCNYRTVQINDAGCEKLKSILKFECDL